MRGIQQFSCLHGLLLEFIRIKGGNALLRGAVFLVGKALLLQPVQQAVPRQQQRRPVADFQILRSDGHALAPDVLHLGPQTLAVHSHAVAQNIHHARAENTGGQQMQCELAKFVHHGVPGVAAALVANDHVVTVGDEVHHPALPLVAPVNAYNRAVCHSASLPKSFIRAGRTGPFPKDPQPF
ncbi:hypothetical protein SDC9_100325 [bioreactor metagenome]|uniref:Uncharacterized protein n=1 Tax=bioreactor metagenome TaxID=1076179 RepID=A0A645AKJ1_9ZZZZ